LLDPIMHRCSRWLLLALLLLGPVSRAAAEERKYALLVGVRDYDHAKLPALQYTENDVEELGRLLEKHGAGFNRVVLLTTQRGKTRPAVQPNARNIRTQLKSLMRNRRRDDTVLIALAGHGIQMTSKDARGKEIEEAFFCPSDAQLNDRDTLISLRTLFRDLDDSGAGVKLLLVDACRNDPKLGRSLSTDSVPRPSRGIAALFSCSAGQRAFETDKLGGGHGVFFHHVIEALGGKARNEDGEVTWDDMTSYVKRQVPRSVVKVIGGGAQQSPHLVANLINTPVLMRAVVEPFNGTDLKGWRPTAIIGQRSKWKVGRARLDKDNPLWLAVSRAQPGKGELINEGKGLDLYTEEKFGDCLIELEFMIPTGSNSGVFVMGEHEVQIFDSMGKSRLDANDMGAIFGVAPPLVNAARRPGEWQKLVIDFRAPRFDGAGNKTDNAKFVKVMLNDRVVQDNVVVKGPTSKVGGGLTGKESAKGPLMLQGGYGPVAFRNIRITPR
jgi:uncharacterized caspase-like protein